MFDFGFKGVIVNAAAAGYAFEEDFESYAIGTDLESEGWVHTPFGADVSEFKVSAGKNGECKVTTGSWAGSFLWSGAGASAWTNYTVEGDVTSHASGRATFGFRGTGAGIYYMQCLPTNISVIEISPLAHPAGATIIDNVAAPATLTSFKIVVSGTSIKIYYNGSGTPTHDIVDATYSTGSIAVGAFAGGWEVDNLKVTLL